MIDRHLRSPAPTSGSRPPSTHFAARGRQPVRSEGKPHPKNAPVQVTPRQRLTLSRCCRPRRRNVPVPDLRADEDVSEMDNARRAGVADSYPATAAATGWSPAARRAACAAAVLVCLLGVTACRPSTASPGTGTGTDSPGSNTPGAGQPQQCGQPQVPKDPSASLPPLGSPFVPKDPSASLPPLPGCGS